MKTKRHSTVAKLAWLVFFLTSLTTGWTQETFDISFAKSKMDIPGSSEDTTIHMITLTTKNTSSNTWNNHKISISANSNLTTLPSRDYTIDFRDNIIDVNKKDNGSRTFYLIIRKDSNDREGKIHLEIKVTDPAGTDVSDKNTGSTKLEITVNRSQKLSGYEFLAYTGTNFDLVEGIKAKNFFFAANILSLPKTPKKVGFYLSLYGNRAMSQVDSNRLMITPTNTKVLSDTTYMQYSNRYQVKRTSVTDNMGAYISALVPWNACSKKTNKNNTDVKWYYAPSLEFVWRRTHLTSEFDLSAKDSAVVSGSPGNNPLLTPPGSITSTFNEYSFNIGALGIFLLLENKNISVRVHGSVGMADNFYLGASNIYSQPLLERKQDIFFSGRAWITEPVSGITLQAEVTNSLINPRPFYVVTLSKAFAFKDIGKIFQPITSKSGS